MPENQPSTIAYFGPFRLDLVSGELHKHGLKLKLGEQPFLILKLLLERSGELVSREELHKLLWPSGTFVDFDHGLNSAIRRLREALSDTQEEPRWVETVPRRGYRFIGRLQGATPEGQGANLPQVLPQVLDVQRATAAPHSKMAIRMLGILGAVLIFVYVWRLEHSQAAAVALRPLPFTAYTGVEVAPSFSPDGSRIAFAWSKDYNNEGSPRYDLYVKVIGTESPVALTNQPSRWISSAWSPDGSQIAIHRVAKSSSGLYLVPVNGGAERQLHSTFAANSSDAAISWSPDGKSIAFSDSPSAQGLRRLQILSLATLESTQIPHNESCKEEYIPAYSHNGKRLAYICSLGWEEYGVAVVNLPEGKPRVLKTFRGWAGGLSWTLGDKSLIFSASQVGHEDDGLRLLSIDDGAVRTLAFGQNAEWPALSPNGDRLVYDNYLPGNTNIWRLDLANLRVPPVEFIVSTRSEYSPKYSPDGTRIVFASTLSGCDEIWMSDADGHNLVQLTHLGRPSGSPSFSPDGKRIAFDSRENGRAEILVMDVQERIPHKVVFNNVKEPSVPSWSRDGNWLYFIAADGVANDKIYRGSANGGDATPLSATPGYAPMESFDGKRVYFATLNGKKAMLKTASLKPTGTEAGVEGIPLLSFAANWTVVRDGIYFYPADSAETLSYFDFASQKVYPIDEVGRGSYYGLSISPDGHYALYSKTEDATSDILMIDRPRLVE
jgi:Tol biopolymer transport system component/DNA-binding winged helix-turn-helix (wHTH) protein